MHLKTWNTSTLFANSGSNRNTSASSSSSFVRTAATKVSQEAYAASFNLPSLFVGRPPWATPALGFPSPASQASRRRSAFEAPAVFDECFWSGSSISARQTTLRSAKRASSKLRSLLVHSDGTCAASWRWAEESVIAGWLASPGPSPWLWGQRKARESGKSANTHAGQ